MNERKLTGPKAKEYNEYDKKLSIQQAKKYIGLTAEERAVLNIKKDEERHYNSQEENTVNFNQTVKNNTHKKLKLRPRAKALIATIMGISSGLVISHAVWDSKTYQDSKETIKSIESTTTTTESVEEENNLQIPKEYLQKMAEGSIEKDDAITYIIDFNDYSNPDSIPTIEELINTGKVKALALKIGGTGYDYPFAIRNFDNPEILNEMQGYAYDVELSGNMGPIENMETFVKMAIKHNIAVGFYYYTCANTLQEAEIEATYIKSVYNKLRNDISDFDTAKIMPTTIDIEEAGPVRDGKQLPFVDQQQLRENRTDAIVHLASLLGEDRIITYKDINRVEDGSYVNWNRLETELEKNNIRDISWGTRALPQTYGHGMIYDNVESFNQYLMNDDLNIEYMKQAYLNKTEYMQNLAMMQIHLDQQINNGTWTQTYDFSVTTEKTLDSIAKGIDIEYKQGFMKRMEEIHNMSKTQKADISNAKTNKAEEDVER